MATVPGNLCQCNLAEFAIKQVQEEYINSQTEFCHFLGFILEATVVILLFLYFFKARLVIASVQLTGTPDRSKLLGAKLTGRKTLFAEMDADRPIWAACPES